MTQRRPLLAEIADTLRRRSTVATAPSPSPVNAVLSPSSRILRLSKFARTMLLTLLVLTCGETAVRVRAFVLHGQTGTEAGIYDTDPVLGSVPRAGASMETAGATTTINEWGLRGDAIALLKPLEAIRVLCLGESTTFGQPHDDDDSIWPARLEQYLRDRSDRGSFEVINGAMIGYTVSQSRINLQRRLARFHPDVVVIYHAATNIAAHARRQFAGGVGGGSKGWSLRGARDKYSLAYLLLRANTASFLAEQFPAARQDELDQRGVTFFADELAALIGDCHRRGQRVLVCTFPRAFAMDQQPPLRRQLARSALFFNPSLSIRGLCDAYDRYNEVIRRVAGDQGALLVDLDRLVSRGPDSFADSVHLSSHGHDEVARILAGAVLDLAEPHTVARGTRAADAVQ